MGIGKFTIITPFMKKGSLSQIIKNEKSGFAPDRWTETKRAINIIGITAGMCYMHPKNVIHRVLKPDNNLLDDDLHPQICDFGLSKVFEEGLEGAISATNCETTIYMAPELINGDDYNSKVDVLAYALILYELYAFESAFESSHQGYVLTYMNCVANGIRPSIKDTARFPPLFRELIDDCWAQKPENRPSFNEILFKMIDAYKADKLFYPLSVEKDDIDEYIRDVINGLDVEIDFT